MLLLGLIGAGVSGLLSAIAGAAFPNSRLGEFEDEIETGKLLIMVEATHDQVPLVDRIVKTRHPEAEIEGFEPRVPILPQ